MSVARGFMLQIDGCNMFKRRSHGRFVVANGEGVLRVPWDVTLTSTAGQMVAISEEPLPVSDAIAGRIALVPVRIEETRPIIVDGEIRHQIRLSYFDPNE